MTLKILNQFLNRAVDLLKKNTFSKHLNLTVIFKAKDLDLCSIDDAI